MSIFKLINLLLNLLSKAMSEDNPSSIEMSSRNPSHNSAAIQVFPKRKKKGFSFTKYVSKKANQASGFIKSFDLYGQPITLNY